MRIDFATLAFGYKVLAGGGTPNWGTALGQGRDYKINDDPAIDEILKGMVYTSAPLAAVSAKLGKGGPIVRGGDQGSPIILAGLFEKVYVNDVLIDGGKFLLLITRDTSTSHAGRLRLKYGTSNTITIGDVSYSNEQFFQQVRRQLSLAEDACWFVSDISVRNQDELVLQTIIVDKNGPAEYANNPEHHRAWEGLEAEAFGVGFDSVERVTGGTNIILYGVPGAGKSWNIQKEYCSNANLMERLVFHPDYTYSDFVGQILPTVAEDGGVSYPFTPGPFTRLLRKAYRNPDKMFYLVIEEVNRGNAPAIFGDIFQLLDRNMAGGSEYEITNSDIAKVVYGDNSHKVSIPSNMTILCTMNTSDQNVFTLDTAFQRRWSMHLIKNRFRDEREERDFATTKILDTSVTWEHFFNEINKIILTKSARMTSSEDKRLGTHFVSKEDLIMGDGSERQISRFPEKVLKYLWDDAFKFTKEDVFDLDKVKSLEDVIEIFVTSEKDDRFLMFKENIYDTLVSQ